ncbi:MAG: HAD family hydrolase [Candidatus Odinarchaeota archaeon]
MIKNWRNKNHRKLSSNYKLGLISNRGVTSGRIVNKIFQRYEIFKYLKVMIYSDEIGYYKLHKILFITVLEHLKCRPQTVIHIGDNLETDIKGAKNCNLYIIWFNESKLPKLENIQPDYEICKFSEIIQTIKEFK